MEEKKAGLMSKLDQKSEDVLEESWNNLDAVEYDGKTSLVGMRKTVKETLKDELEENHAAHKAKRQDRRDTRATDLANQYMEPAKAVEFDGKTSLVGMRKTTKEHRDKEKD